MIQYGPPGCGRARRDEAVRKAKPDHRRLTPLAKGEDGMGFCVHGAEGSILQVNT